MAASPQPTASESRRICYLDSDDCGICREVIKSNAPVSGNTNAFSAYLPEDRLVELAGGAPVPQQSHGAVLFADVVGFTGLTSRLVQLLGRRRGAEEVPVYLNRLYEALIGQVRASGGSVIGFAGDAITCWFQGDDGRLAVQCGLAMQKAMEQFDRLKLAGTSGSESISLALKVAVAAGKVRRFVVGDPRVQLMDVLAGGPLAEIETLEGAALKGQVLISNGIRSALGDELSTRPAGDQGKGGAHLVLALAQQAGLSAAAPGSPQPEPSQEALGEWLLPTVKSRLAAGAGDFLTELRPVAALFLSFSLMDVDDDENAVSKFSAVVTLAQKVASEYGGNVLQVSSGDKGNYLYMAFGAPVSHEDDVSRCAAAALDLRDALQKFDFLKRTGIGLGYGTARTGAYGSASRRTYGALGEGVNMAARMMSVAPHGEIYASGPFADRAGNDFRLVSKDGVRVKGRDSAVRAHALMGRQRAGQTGRGKPRNTLFGRESELRLIQEHFVRAASGEGQIVQLVADAGMGKTELLEHALASINNAHVTRNACQPFGITAPYQLWKGVFHQLLGLDEGSSATARMAGVRPALELLDGRLAAQASLLAPVLDLPLDIGQQEASRDAEERNSARHALLLNIFRQVARRTGASGRTLVLVLEDLQWLDPASDELLKAVAQSVPALPVMVMTAARPSQNLTGPAPGRLDGAETVQLAPLDDAAASAAVSSRLAQAPHLAKHEAELCQAILRRSQGNPLYLLELAADVIQRSQSNGLHGDLAAELPDSLHSLILGRLDRLENSQRVNLKVASVIGREFRTAWLVACQTGVTEDDCEAGLSVTSELGLTSKFATQPGTHEFRHAMTAEVAYESQPHAARTKLHTLLAQFIEQEVASAIEPNIDLLAYHYGLGEDPDKARYYLSAAAGAARQAYANGAALDYLRRLLELQDGEDRLLTLLELGEVATFSGSYGAAAAYITEALDLAGSWGDDRRKATALRLMGELLERQGDHSGARQQLEEAAGLCRRTGEQAELTRVLLALGGNVLWHLGDYNAAEIQLEEAVQLARAAGDARQTARALHGTANIHLYRGNSQAAEAAFTESLEVRREAGDEYGVANALNNLAIIHANGGDGPGAEALLAESLEIRERLGDVSGVAVALNNLGYLAAARGDLEAARRMYGESLAARRELGDRLGLAISLNNLAGLMLRSGETETAREYWLESVTLAGRLGNRREAAVALAGLANATDQDADGARMAVTAEWLMSQLGAAVDPEVQENIERGKSRQPGVAVPARLDDSLEEALAWAIHGPAADAL